MKLTQQQQKDLADIIGRLERAERFIKNDSTEIVRDFGGSGKASINKEIGSDLCYLYQAKTRLIDFLNSAK